MVGVAFATSVGAGAGYAEDILETATVPSTHVHLAHPSQRGTRSCGLRRRLPLSRQRPSSKPQRQYRLQQLPRPLHPFLFLRLSLRLRLHLFLHLPPPPPPSPPHDATIRIIPKDRHLPLPSIRMRIRSHTPNRTHTRMHIRPHTTTPTRRPCRNASDPPVSKRTTTHVTASPTAPHRRRRRHHRPPTRHTQTERRRAHARVRVRMSSGQRPRVRARHHTSNTGTPSGHARAPRWRRTTRTGTMAGGTQTTLL